MILNAIIYLLFIFLSKIYLLFSNRNDKKVVIILKEVPFLYPEEVSGAYMIQ